jgi:hypothetical protein
MIDQTFHELIMQKIESQCRKEQKREEARRQRNAEISKRLKREAQQHQQANTNAGQ